MTDWFPLLPLLYFCNSPDTCYYYSSSVGSQRIAKYNNSLIGRRRNFISSGPCLVWIHRNIIMSPIVFLVRQFVNMKLFRNNGAKDPRMTNCQLHALMILFLQTQNLQIVILSNHLFVPDCCVSLFFVHSFNTITIRVVG